MKYISTEYADFLKGIYEQLTICQAVVGDFHAYKRLSKKKRLRICR